MSSDMRKELFFENTKVIFKKFPIFCKGSVHYSIVQEILMQ